jgi:HD superfamily phosphodiesterase
MEKVSNEDAELLITAALFHDTGFLWAYEKNEPIACRFANEVLPDFGYNPMQISAVCNLISSTAMPQKPKTLLEKIICDADLDYIGREDFFITALRLHREWSENSEHKTSFRDWYEKQRSFMESHVFFTNSARLLRNERKKKNLMQVNELLELIDNSTSSDINLATRRNN